MLDDDTGVENAMLWLRFYRKFDNDVGVYASGHVGVEDLGEDNRDRNRLREAYVDLRLKRWDVRIGKQIIAWGRADRINPTDNLTPRDFTLLVPEEDDNRFGSSAVRTKLALGSNTRCMQSGCRISVRTTIRCQYRRVSPSRKILLGGADNFAIKFEQSGGRCRLVGVLFLRLRSGAGLALQDQRPARLSGSSKASQVSKCLGMDGATTAGLYGVRWELAYTRTKDRDGDDPEIKNPFFYGVLGVERMFLDNLNVNVQLYSRYVSKYTRSRPIWLIQ